MTAIVSFTPVSEGQTESCPSPQYPDPEEKDSTQSGVSAGANLPEWHRGFIRELVHCILFARRMWHFELPAGVKAIGWIEMFPHPYQAQADNVSILLESSVFQSTLISLQRVLMGA